MFPRICTSGTTTSFSATLYIISLGLVTLTQTRGDKANTNARGDYDPAG